MTQGQDSFQLPGYDPKYMPKPWNVVWAHWHWRPFWEGRKVKYFTSQHPRKVMAQRDQGRPCVLVTGKEQGYDLHPLLGTGRGGKDEKVRAQAPESSPCLLPLGKGWLPQGSKIKKKIFKNPTAPNILLVSSCYSDLLMPKMGSLAIACLLGSSNEDTVIHLIWAAGFHLASVLETLPAAMLGFKILRVKPLSYYKENELRKFKKIPVCVLRKNLLLLGTKDFLE